MESFLSRYRNLTVLLIVIAGQLLLLAYQVRTNRDVRLIRVWTVSTVTPMAQVLEAVRQNTFGLVENYFVLLGVREENQKLRQELGQQKIQNHFLRTELSTADRAKALAAFAQETPSKTIAARIIGDGTGPNSATVFVDRGSGSGIERGMAAITPDGIVGKVVEAYPTASLVQLITDPAFAAGVVSQKNHIHGTLKGMGHGQAIVDYVQNEEKVDVGEWFYTSGYDRVFPRGFPVGQASVVRNGRSVKEIYIRPSGLVGGLEEVLIVLRGVHQAIPDHAPSSTAMYIAPPPPDSAVDARPAGQPPVLKTEADKIRSEYQAIGAWENHPYGALSSKVPDFNVKAPVAAAAPPQAGNPAAKTGEVARTGEPGKTGERPGGLEAKKEGVTPPGVKPKPKPVAAKVNTPATSGPLLITDPTDADVTDERALESTVSAATREAKSQAAAHTPLAHAHGAAAPAKPKSAPKPPAISTPAPDQR